MIGRSETITAAKIRFQREANAPTNVYTATGNGVSKKGGGLTVGGAGGGGGAGFSMSSSDYKASAIGEAQAAACKELVAKFVAQKDELEP